jgi:hypothetical protein
MLGYSDLKSLILVVPANLACATGAHSPAMQLLNRIETIILSVFSIT